MLFAFTSDQQENPHAQNHVAVERPVLVGEPDHFRKHPSVVFGRGGPICRPASGNGVPTSGRRRWRQRGATRGRGRDSNSVPHEEAERDCIFRHPLTTLSAYLWTVLRQGTASDRAIDDDNGDGDEDSKRNRRPPCGAYARDGTAGPDMAITGVDLRGLSQAQALPRRLPSAQRGAEFSTTGWSVYRVAHPRRLSTFPYPTWLSNAVVSGCTSHGRSRSVMHSPSRPGEFFVAEY